MELKVLPVPALKPKVTDESQLVFGKLFSDRMFIMEYDAGQGWLLCPHPALWPVQY